MVVVVVVVVMFSVRNGVGSLRSPTPFLPVPNTELLAETINITPGFRVG